jgi:hypothetical protein
MPRHDDGAGIQDDDGYDDSDFDASPSPVKATARARDPRPAASASSTGAAATSSPHRQARQPSAPVSPLPVLVPYSVLHPVLQKGATTVQTLRSRDTVIINRTASSAAALNMLPGGAGRAPVQRPASAAARGGSAASSSSAASIGDNDSRDVTHARSAAVWHKDYLDELAYATTSKARGAARRAESDRRQEAAEAAKKSSFMSGGRRTSAPPVSFGGEAPAPARKQNNIAAFFDRQLAVEKARMAARTEARLALDYAVRHDKHVCSECGAEQTFAEMRGAARRCTRDGCGRGTFGPKLKWGEVRHSFLKRLSDFLEEQKRHEADAHAADRAEMRTQTRTRFNKATGEAETVTIVPAAWSSVAADFLQRQADFLARKAETEKKLEAARNNFHAGTGRPKLNNNYRFSKPLPSFHERQAAALARRDMSFEERLEALHEATGHND